MQKISMAMPTGEHARRNWIVGPQHLTLFSFLAFENMHFILQFPLGRRGGGTEGWLVPKSTGI